MGNKKDGFWGHNPEDRTETDSEGRLVHFQICLNCGERLEPDSEWAEKTIEREYPIYVCTAPFGVLSRDLSGEIAGSSSGFLTFNSGSIHGSLNSDLEETYIVKYLDGNLLKTKSFTAEKTDIIVDGRFCLTCDERIQYKQENGELKETYRYTYTYLRLHIPSLPKLGITTIEKIPLLTSEEHIIQ